MVIRKGEVHVLEDYWLDLSAPLSGAHILTLCSSNEVYCYFEIWYIGISDPLVQSPNIGLSLETWTSSFTETVNHTP